MDKLKVFEIGVGEVDDLELGMTAVALVDDPAVEINWLKFNKQSKDDNVAKLDFKVTDEEKQIISGVVAIPDKLIYRYDESMGEYFVKFTKEGIEQMRNKYSVSGQLFSINEMHNNDIKPSDIYIVESYLITENVKNEHFKDVPNGTWIMSFYVKDKEYWESKIKSEEFKGFSLEGMFSLKELEFKNNQFNMSKKVEKNLLAKLAKVFKEHFEEVVVEDAVIEDEEVIIDTENENPEEDGFAEVVDVEGDTYKFTPAVVVDATVEVLEGEEFVKFEGDEVVVGYGLIEIEGIDGEVSIVVEDGVITDVIAIEEEEEEEAEEVVSEELYRKALADLNKSNKELAKVKREFEAFKAKGKTTPTKTKKEVKSRVMTKDEKLRFFAK